MKTVKNPTSEDIVAKSVDGMHGARVAAGATKTVSEPVFSPLCAAGCVPAGDNAYDDNPATDVDEARVILLESVINAVLDEGNPGLLTRDGCPRASVLDDRFGDHTTEERKTAWNNVKATRDRD